MVQSSIVRHNSTMCASNSITLDKLLSKLYFVECNRRNLIFDGKKTVTPEFLLALSLLRASYLLACSIGVPTAYNLQASGQSTQAQDCCLS